MAFLLRAVLNASIKSSNNQVELASNSCRLQRHTSYHRIFVNNKRVSSTFKAGYNELISFTVTLGWNCNSS